MIIVTGAPCSGKTTLCQTIDAVELSVSDTLKKTQELEALGEPYTVIFLFCNKGILISRAIAKYDQGALKHVAEISRYQEPHLAQVRRWFKDFMVLHTDAGIDYNAIGALNASRERRVEVPTSGAQVSRVL